MAGTTSAKVWSDNGGKLDAVSKRAEHCLSILELAKELGNVAEACR